MKRFTGTTNKKDFNDELDSLLNDTRDLVIQKLKPLADAGRLLCLTQGNHEKSIKKYYSYDIMKDICKELKVTYSDYSFMMRMVLKSKGQTRNLMVYGHHGFGGGRRSGGALNRREDLIRTYDADIYLMGHDHQKFGKRFIRLAMPQNGECRLVHKPCIVAATGSFLKTVIQGDTTYAEQFGYPANDLGVIRIDVSFEGHRCELDLHVSE